MKGIRAFVVGLGLISPVAAGVPGTRDAIMSGRRAMGLLSLFPVPQDRLLPVGQIDEVPEVEGLPRTHLFALMAAQEAMSGSEAPPDAIVVGCTTGGMAVTEEHLHGGKARPDLFKYHGLGSVAEYLAQRLGCRGPVLTVSTACSSGAAAIKLAVEMLREGSAETVLAGGADSLCRLTYHGFNSLQLIDPSGARPFDADRRGMTVSEGAGMLLLKGLEEPPPGALAEILGGGLSCDAYHPASPDPRGRGALAAMGAALEDAGITPSEIDYVNLHGTGTIDNDLSEARAFNRIFSGKRPLHSSVKGAFGHGLAAAGAIEAVLSVMAVSRGIVPANTGTTTPDPKLGLDPVTDPLEEEVRTVLSNSFGFGGNNASLVIGRPGRGSSAKPRQGPLPLTVSGAACITGAGKTAMTKRRIWEGRSCAGMLPDGEMAEGLPQRSVRRLKRLSRMALSLAVEVHGDSDGSEVPVSMFFGTGWGPFSEAYDFLEGLFESGGRFAGPTDFIGSVHNAPAAAAALHFGARGPNITTVGGDYSFEQALMAASLVAGVEDEPILVAGVDEHHRVFSPLCDGSAEGADVAADGGGALCLRRDQGSSGPEITPLFFRTAWNNPSVISELVERLGRAGGIGKRYGAILAGIPLAHRDAGRDQISRFLSASGFEGPVVDYRRLTGEFASASAVAAVLAVSFLEEGELPSPLTRGRSPGLREKGILILGLGRFVTSMEVMPSGRGRRADA